MKCLLLPLLASWGESDLKKDFLLCDEGEDCGEVEIVKANDESLNGIEDTG